ncbi:HAD family hydrolase [Acidobacteriota bacterium]
MLKGIIFDMDGTIFDAPYDWPQIGAELETHGKPILSFLNELEEPAKSEKWKVLEKHEKKATQQAVLKKGMFEFLNFLEKKGTKKALVTNNSENNVSFLLEKYQLDFDCVISRERGLWKPSGAPFLAALEELRLTKEVCGVVGDSHFDIEAAKDAGINHVFVLNENKELFSSSNVEVFPCVEDLKKRLERLVPGTQ